ncbi:MAG: hypothetical protein ACFBSG_14510 [Leptolyngbyaceae cyanobacterium]
MADQSNSFSIQESLLSDTQALAEALDISWPQLVTLALQDFVRRHQDRQDLTAQINAAYDDGLDDDEMRFIQATRISHRHIVEGEW